MNGIYLLGGAIAVGLLAYLLFSLFRAEDL